MLSLRIRPDVADLTSIGRGALDVIVYWGFPDDLVVQEIYLDHHDEPLPLEDFQRACLELFGTTTPTEPPVGERYVTPESYVDWLARYEEAGERIRIAKERKAKAACTV
jgi:hypothetical protein